MISKLRQSTFIIRISITFLLLALFACGEDEEQAVEKAKNLLNEGNFSMAISVLDQVTQQDTDNADAWNMLGIAHYETKSFEKSMNCFNKAIKINNQNYKYFYNRANAQRELKMLLEALEDYTKAIDLEKNNADIYFNRAVVFMSLNRKSEAIPDFEYCIKLAPDFAKAYFGLASANISLRQTVQPENCQQLQKALDLGYAEAKEALALYCP
jgi:tetratricopeptide (TPR) repeat protein